MLNRFIFLFAGGALLLLHFSGFLDLLSHWGFFVVAGVIGIGFLIAALVLTIRGTKSASGQVAFRDGGDPSSPQEKFLIKGR